MVRNIKFYNGIPSNSTTMHSFKQTALVLTALLALTSAQVPNSCTSWTKVDVGAEVTAVVRLAVSFVPEYVCGVQNHH